MAYTIEIKKGMIAVAEGSIAVGATAVGIPTAALDLAKGGDLEVHLSVEVDQIRASAFAAATSSSHRYDVGDHITVAGPKNCRNWSMIQVTAAATVRYTVYGKAI